MRKIFLCLSLFCSTLSFTQLPCSAPEYRQFDFWIGEWSVYNNKNGNKAGDSKISILLDSCIILEEWTSANTTKGLRYAGKSFNKYNPLSKQWQQTWVDNVGGSTEFLHGQAGDGKIVFSTDPFHFKKDSLAIRRLSFYKLGENKVRQHGEISKDDGNTWVTEYDLEYRRNEETVMQRIDKIFRAMEEGFRGGDYKKIASFYSDNGKIFGKGIQVSGKDNLNNYWKRLVESGGTWSLTNNSAEQKDNLVWEKGVSVIKDKSGAEHRVSFTLILVQEKGEWKILQDAYW